MNTAEQNGNVRNGDSTRSQCCMGQLIESLADTLIEAGPLVRQLEEGVAHQHQQNIEAFQNIEGAAARHDEQLRQTQDRIVGLERNLGIVIRVLAEVAETGARLRQQLVDVGLNLDQVRLLVETSVERQQRLVDDFIERHVTDHLFKEFARLGAALRQTASQPKDLVGAQLNDIADSIDLFLNDSELRLLHPVSGESLNPREHQPILVVETGSADLDGNISQTLVPGLARKHRVIQLARVGVFKFSVNNKTNGAYK